MSAREKRLYDTAAWGKIRRLAFVRDLYTCKICGCSVSDHPSVNNQPNQAIADHIVPHNGTADLFFDLANIQTLCKRDHDSIKQSQEKLGYSKQIGLDGWPVDPKHPSNLKHF